MHTVIRLAMFISIQNTYIQLKLRCRHVWIQLCIDCLRACLIAMLVSLCNIQSRVDHAHWFGIDCLRACLIARLVSLCNIQSRVDHVHWYGIGQLRVCLIAMLVSLCNIQSREECAHWFGIDCLRDCFVVDNLTCCARINTVPDEVLRVRHFLHVKTVVDKNTSMLINKLFFKHTDVPKCFLKN